VFKGLDQAVKNYLVSVPLVADLRSPAMRPRHWALLMEATGVTFDIANPAFQLGQLLALELHRFEEEARAAAAAPALHCCAHQAAPHAAHDYAPPTLAIRACARRRAGL
jgi:hypothetical protein